MAGAPSPGQSTARSLQIENDTASAIREIYFSRRNSPAWATDILKDDVLSPGYKVTISLTPGVYDVRLVDRYGEACIIPGVTISGNEHILHLTPQTLFAAGCELGGGGSGGGSPSEATAHSLPWPPPAASTSEPVPSVLFKHAKQMKDVDALLGSALEKNRYFEKSYYPVPGGFAIVTRIEQIEPDGTSKKGTARWSTDYIQPDEFSLGAYLRALFTANPGYYRMILFVVTAVPFTQSGTKLSEDESNNRLKRGYNRLPEEIGKQPFSDAIVCTALIYEFERQQDKTAELRSPSRLDARTHLEKSGIWTALQQGQ